MRGGKSGRKAREREAWLDGLWVEPEAVKHSNFVEHFTSEQ